MNALAKDPVKNFQFHGGGVLVAPVNPSDGESGLAKALKNAKLANYRSKTIGEAVDGYRYFTKREWKETRTSSGKMYVDFTGWFNKSNFDTSSVVQRGVGIKFMVRPDGNYAVVMVSKVEIRTDGVVHSDPLPESSPILNKIYGNTEIKF
jgi:hypothetical protein